MTGVTIKNFEHDFIENEGGRSKISITGYVNGEKEKQTIFFESNNDLLEGLGAKKVTVRDVAGKVIRVMAVPAALAGGFFGAYMMLNDGQRERLMQIMNHAKALAMQAGADVSKAIAYAQDKLSGYTKAISDNVEKYVRAAATYGSNAIYAVTDKILTFFGGVTDMIRGMFNDVAESVKTAVGGIDKGVREIGTRMVSNATNATETVQQWWNSSVGSNTSDEVSSWWTKFTSFDWDIYMIGTMVAVLGVTIWLAYHVYRKFIAAEEEDTDTQIPTIQGGGYYSQLLPMFSLATSYIQQAVTTIENIIQKQKYTTVLYMALGVAVLYLIRRIFTRFKEEVYDGKNIGQILEEGDSVKDIMTKFGAFMGTKWQGLLTEIRGRWKDIMTEIRSRWNDMVDGVRVEGARKTVVRPNKVHCRHFNNSPQKCWEQKKCFYNDGEDTALPGKSGKCYANNYEHRKDKEVRAIQEAREKFEQAQEEKARQDLREKTIRRFQEQRKKLAQDAYRRQRAKVMETKMRNIQKRCPLHRNEAECNGTVGCLWDPYSNKCNADMLGAIAGGGSDDNKGGIFY